MARQPKGRATMASFRYGHSAHADWRYATDACLAQLGAATGTLGFLYASDHFAGDLGLILERVKRATGIGHWVGTVGMGVVATGREYVDVPAVTAMVADF